MNTTIEKSVTGTKIFRFETRITWTGGASGVVEAGDHAPLAVGSPPEFGGDETLWSPEQLVVAALNTCFMLTFAASARRRGFLFKAYSGTTEGKLELVDRSFQLTQFMIHPHILVTDDASVETAMDILRDAEKKCFISRSVSGAVLVEPTIQVG